MTAYALKSYGGNAWPAYLLATVGPTDTTFTLTPAPGGSLTSWTEPSGSPLGTSGNFEMKLDAGLPTEEKVLCSAINTSTGAVTVASGGRGYDQTTAQTHQTQSSFGGLAMPCLTSIDMRETNQLVNYLLGSSPSNGQLLQWNTGSSKPTWVNAVAGVTGIPAGRICASGVQSFASGSTTQVTLGTTSFLKGSMTAGTNSLVVGTTGIYEVTGKVYWQVGATLTRAVVSIYQNGSAVTQLDGADNNAFTTVMDTDLISCTSGDVLTMYAEQTNMGSTAINTTSFSNNYLTAVLVSA